MRIKFLSLFCCLLTMGVFSSFAQTAEVTINENNVTLKEVIAEIEKQTNYLFIYNDQVDIEQNVSVNAVGTQVEKVLKEVLKDTGIDYKQDATHIILSKADKQDANNAEGPITGVVTDKNGQPLIGVTIVVSGTTRGTVTMVEGAFTIIAAPGQVLDVSYIGYASKKVQVGTGKVLNIVLEEDVISIDNVVVTALGIKRTEKSLSYGVQEVGSDELTRVKDANFLNSLNGKVAGVNINSSSTGIGGASRVVMRGTKSITKENNALYVIDGVPMLNTHKGKLETSGEYNKQPRGENVSDINPEDIESISVLSGPAASALYGSEAANGVILITTKKGRVGKPQVTLSNQTMFSTPFLMPKFQNTYGNKPGNYSSWGQKLANPSGFDPEKFFNTGYSTQSGVSISVGSEKNQTYASASNVESQGIVPNNKFQRTSVNFRNTTSFLDDKMVLDGNFMYVDQRDKNMLAQGQYYNPLVSLYTFPRGEDFDNVRAFERYNQIRDIYEQNWAWGDQGMQMQNPYWIAHRNLHEGKRVRIMAGINLSYDVLPWLNLSGRLRTDRSNGDFTEKLYASTNELFSGYNGFYQMQKEEEAQIYADFLVNINKRFGDFSVMANMGTSISDTRFSIAGAQGPLKNNPNHFTLLNIDRTGRDAANLQKRWHDQNQSVFASFEAGWKSMVYMTLTGRNEWASQLANTSQSNYFFPSVGLSGIISEMVKMPKAISYLKVRTSLASVGSPIPRHISITGFGYAQGIDKWETQTHRPIEKLKPERTDSWEVGLDARFFKSKLRLDLTYYDSNTKNQTILVPISASSTWKEMYIQTGSVKNSGIEGLLSYGNKWGGFGWDVSLTASYNKNKIGEIVKNFYDKQTGEYINLDMYSGGGVGGVKFILKKGGTMGDIWATNALEKDQNGYIYVHPVFGNVNIVNLAPDEYKKLGSTLPKWHLGFHNNFSWKNINLGVMVTARLGGVVVSPTQAILDGFGVSKTSAEARDKGGVPVNLGVVDPQMWYETIGRGGVYSHYVYKADNVRLQELSLGYSMPSSWFGGVVKVDVSLVGKNLFMIYKRAPFDPEQTSTTGTYYQGVDYFMQPSLRSLGFNIQMKF